MRNLIIIFTLLFSFQPALADDITPQEKAITEANQFFKQGNEIANDSLSKRDELYRKALLRYEKVIQEDKVNNAALYYNAANIHFLLGELGLAVLNYRKAEILDPSDKNIQQNLAYVRSKRIDKINEEHTSSSLKTIFFWHYTIPYMTKIKLTITFWALFWILVVLRRLKVKPSSRTLIVLCAVITLTLAASAYIQGQVKSGVITINEVIARKGDGYNYDPSFNEPLHAGTEFIIKEKRDAWTLIQLNNGDECWLPKDTFAEV